MEKNIETEIEIKTANQWMREAKAKPVPKELFGEFWFEGELSVLFGDTGAGKSVLATAIAETVARGCPMKPFENTVRPQKVLYIDIGLSSGQFGLRYSVDHDPAKGKFTGRSSRFSDRFQRIELTDKMLPVSRKGRFEADLRQMLKELVDRSGAKVLIIDSLWHLKRTADDTRGFGNVVKELKGLKDECGIAILLIANSLKRSPWRPIVADDVQAARSIATYADNIFAIGRCRSDAGLRYIKHIRARSCEPLYGAGHLPVFRIAKIGGDFLGFEFRWCAWETALTRNTDDLPYAQLVEQVHRSNNAGMSIRQIAAELKISKSTVHRYMHTPLPRAYAPVEQPQDAIKKRWNYFPGMEEFQAAKDDPRFDDIFGREDAEAYALRREAFQIEGATAIARKQYLETGRAPTLAEALAQTRKLDDERRRQFEDYEEELSGPSDPGEDMLAELPPPDEPDLSAVFGTDAPLQLALDGHGNEIYVQSYEEYTGKPGVWFKTDKRGNKFRFLRNALGVSREQLVE